MEEGLRNITVLVYKSTMLSDNILDDINFKSERDRNFFERIYSTPLNLYKDRLRSLTMENKKNVLDAGCGFGQWSLGLADLNERVCAIDMDYNNVHITKIICGSFGKKNVSLYSGSVEELPFHNNTFDAIFSYSVIYFTDYKKAVSEFYRVLKPDGIMHLCTNGLGWYLNCIIMNRNSTSDFSARRYGLETILSSINYSITGKRRRGTSVVMSPGSLSTHLRSVGFKNIISAPEGVIRLNKEIQVQPFYDATYLGFTNVFEMLAKK